MRRRRAEPTPPAKTIRCAVYTRKSSEEGLQQDFNSLDAQREAGEAYIASQKTEGWVCLPDRYDDGGYTGGNMDRPALQQLLADIKAGKVDCVAVYKVDRLSRSLLDFARIVEAFDKHHVAFVSVTQHFNTSTSMGRLILNVLLSFAQFEREIISERTRDKIAAARRRGQWSGGRPILGYDVITSPGGSKLAINEEEAARVRAIFELYLEHERLIPVVQELDQRGWLSKQWVTRKEQVCGGRPFDKGMLFRLLTNPLYRGKIKYGQELHDGQHSAIVDETTWNRVQAVLHRNGRTGGGPVKNKHGALLKGLIRCVPCDCAMVHSFTTRGPKTYRYYVCGKAMKRGWHTCPTRSVPVGEMDHFVVEQIRRIGRDRKVLAETLRQVRAQIAQTMAELESEQNRLGKEIRSRTQAVLATDATKPDDKRARLLEEIGELEARAAAVRERSLATSQELIDEHQVADTLAAFDPVWDTLSPRERARIVRLLVERVDYDGRNGTVKITFRPTGIQTLVTEQQEDAA